MHDKEIMELSRYRLERAFEVLGDAHSLFEAGSYRSSNNRAYYAIFHAVRALLAQDQKDFKKHSGVIQYFQKEYIKTRIFEEEYSDIIMNASRIRNVSDYDDFYIASRAEAEEQILDADKLCNRIKEYLDRYYNTNA